MSEEPKFAPRKKKRGPGRPKDPITRPELLAAARGAFADRGYAGASMAEIAAAAGIGKASLFHHFPSKDQLYLEVLAEALSSLGTFVDTARLLSSEPFFDRLDQLSDGITDFLSTHPDAARLLLREFTDRGPFTQGEGGQLAPMILQAAVEFLRGGIEEGAIPEQDCASAIMSITGLHFFYFALPNLSGPLTGREIGSDADRAARRDAVRAHVRGLLLGADRPSSG